MKKIILENHVKIKGIRNFSGKEKLIDYYLELPGKEDVYAFSKAYTKNTYEMQQMEEVILTLLDEWSKKEKR